MGNHKVLDVIYRVSSKLVARVGRRVGENGREEGIQRNTKNIQIATDLLFFRVFMLC